MINGYALVHNVVYSTCLGPLDFWGAFGICTSTEKEHGSNKILFLEAKEVNRKHGGAQDPLKKH